MPRYLTSQVNRQCREDEGEGRRGLWRGIAEERLQGFVHYTRNPFFKVAFQCGIALR